MSVFNYDLTKNTNSPLRSGIFQIYPHRPALSISGLIPKGLKTFQPSPKVLKSEENSGFYHKIEGTEPQQIKSARFYNKRLFLFVFNIFYF
jgi:hypothetical protein